MKLNVDELDCLTAALWFAHLNRAAFYKYVTEQGHEYIANFMEQNDINELRQKLSSMLNNLGEQDESTRL